VKPGFLYLLLALPSLTIGSEHEWHWVKAGNSASGGWDVSTGRADVTIKGGDVTATLFREDSDTDVQIILKGSISGE